MAKYAVQCAGNYEGHYACHYVLAGDYVGKYAGKYAGYYAVHNLIFTLPPPIMFYFCRFIDLEYQTTSLQYFIVLSLFFLYVVFFVCACPT